MPTVSPAGSISSSYEIANALGRLNADRPKLGQRCTEDLVVAKAIKFLLYALDLHMQNTGASLEKIAADVRAGRIELRLNGPRAIVIMP